MEGKVAQINIKSHKEFKQDSNETGLPKHAVDTVEVTLTGVGNDYNHYRTTEKRSTPSRAILLFTDDMIKQLNSEGWNVKPGDIGENFTIFGVPYDYFQIGKQYQIGDTLVEITEKCNPCRNLAALPYVSDKVDEFITTMKNRRGWYAKVITIGTVNTGDTVSLHDF